MLFHQQPWMNFLVSPSMFFGLPAFWVFGVFSLVHFMMTRKAAQVKQAMRVYNVVQIVTCGYMVWGLWPCLGFPNLFGVSTDFDESGEWFVFVHYLSKYLDWFDTLWIVLNKKRSQLSFLHIYHHGTIVPVWGMLLSEGVGSGSVRYGAFINSLTHVIMYSHYLWTSFGFKNPFKKYITMWQISQFYSCLVHAFVVLAFDTSRVREYAWIQVLYQVTMVYLFSSMMSWVPPCVPDFTAQKGEPSVSCFSLCSGVDGQEAAPEEQTLVQMAWSQKYVVVRGKAYDVTSFKHPGGEMMIDLAVGRDATVMFESAHLRADVASKALEALPKFEIEELEKKGFDFGRKETWPTPNESKLYETIRKRVVEEVLKPRGVKGSGARGVPAWHYITVITFWLFSAVWFVSRPSILSGLCLGWSIVWIGTGVQHTANHGGLSTDPRVGYVLGLLNDLAAGGSSIVWRYHHQVAHHAYCNDITLDPDAYSSFPVVRLESSQKRQPYHRFQWIYAHIAFSFLWISVQLQDLACLLNSQFEYVSFKGTKSLEIVLGILLKVVHFCWIVVLPYQIHGLEVMLYPWMTCFGFGGWLLSAMFIVSHNVDHTKVNQIAKGDWARQQIETSTSWGGTVGSFLSGGLNLQIEHHLFPCLAHHLYPQVQVIVKEECKKNDIKYSSYPTLLPNLIDHVKFLHQMGQPDAKPNGKAD